jgi:tetratricopeptide (TPR) repeat protein
MMIRYILLGLVLVMLLFGQVESQSIKRQVPQPRMASTSYDRGSEALKKGDADSAIAHYTAAISDNENSASAYAGRGAAKRLKGDFTGALSDLNRSIELDPKIQSPYYTRAWVNLILNNGSAAYADAAKVLSFNESNYLVFPSHVLIAYFGLRQAKKDAEADAFLRSMMPKLFAGATATHVLRYLKHDITDDQLFATANGPRAMVEAKTFVGLDQALTGKSSAAVLNLRWVTQNTDRRAYEFGLASTELERLESAGKN